tara:strand:- start:235 stop:501 length:267 start_codon:yes stop_codon:yes gene_type:complete
MKSFFVKTVVVAVVFYILFEVTIGSRLDKIENYFAAFKNKQERTKVKEKILIELEKANKKDQILNEREKKIISEFLQKIQNEIGSYNP